MATSIETVIVGGGQAGLALSYFLGQLGREHIIFEKTGQPADAWRNHRWDSFTLVTPNSTFLLPGAEYRGDEPEGFLPRLEVIQRLEQYVDRYHLPVQFGTEVSAVEAADVGQGFLVRTQNGDYRARNAVIATGFFQKEKTPAAAADLPESIRQIHSGEYRRERDLPPGAVLVVGSAQSGCQIAEELYQSGRKVYLATGSTGPVPRRYRGRDSMEWLRLAGFFDRTPDMLPSPRARLFSAPHMSGKGGGHDINLHRFYRDGVMLLGSLEGFAEGKLHFAPNLKEHLTKGEHLQEELLSIIDGFIARSGLPAPDGGHPDDKAAYQAEEITSLEPLGAGISAVVWAVGYRYDYSQVKFPIFDDMGLPLTRRGEAAVPGLYFLGVTWQSKMKSGFLMGVGEDAEYLSTRIAG